MTQKLSPDVGRPQGASPLAAPLISPAALTEPRSLPGHRAAAPEAGGGVCIWLTSSRPELLREVAPALRDRLRAQLREVELLPARLGGPESEPAPGRGRPGTIEVLAEAARSLTRHGIHVVVACPLASPGERSRTRELVPRLIEIFLRPAPGPLRGPEGIPVIYRWMTNGRIEERELPYPTFDAPDRPDVIIDGSLGSPPDVAADILDVLERAGWLNESFRAPDLGAIGPQNDGPSAEGVPLAGIPAARN
jgi:adenylylsulfate kinase-like enzyme